MLFSQLTAHSGQSLVYLVLAACFMVLAIRLIRQALAPIGAIIRAAAALACTGLAFGTALLLIAATLIAGRQ